MACFLMKFRSTLAMLVLVNVWRLFYMKADAGGVNLIRKYCDEENLFAPSEDLNFVQMLDNLLENTRTTSFGVAVTAKDREGRFEGRAGCLWQNCQIYDGECYDCHSARDAAVCIENLIYEVKSGLRERNADCQRTREFASGERSVAVDETSTSFQVCGLQYKYLGKDYISVKNRAGY